MITMNIQGGDGGSGVVCVCMRGEEALYMIY